MKTITIAIEGMKCGGCVKSVQKALTALKGIKKAEVSLEKKNAAVTYDEEVLTEDEIIGAVEDTGFEAGK